MKKRGFGAGRFNGFGGKLKVGETVEVAARREVFEEAGINVKSMSKVAVIEFEFQGNPELLEVHLFKIHEFSGEPQEGEEMRPQWFFVDEIPFRQMWSDDPYWFPYFLTDRQFSARFLFDKEEKVLDYHITEKK